METADFSVTIPNEWIVGINQHQIEELADLIMSLIQVMRLAPDTAAVMQYQGVTATLEKTDSGYFFKKI